VEYVSTQPMYPKKELPKTDEELSTGATGLGGGDRDALFNEAAKMIVYNGQGSASILQRRLKIGYNRAGRLIEQLEDAGIVGPHVGSKAREVLVDDDDLHEMGIL
ncbi:DNA translocase FtsK, partial [bacterium]|nr:DNA translocase FtsK [bacterium]